MTVYGYDRGNRFRGVDTSRFLTGPNQVLPIAGPPPILLLKYDYANSNISTANSPPIIIQAGPSHHNRERESYPSAEYLPKKA